MKCSDKEWQHCQEEKRGCEGCAYNDEISIGEYVRTKDGRIETIKVINKYDIITLHEDDNDTFSEGLNWYAESGREINEEDITKHSKNKIDLIEEGDYVNGYYCKRIPNFSNKMCNFDLNTMEWTPLENIDIWYNILTKEQYNANCYVVKE